MEKNASKMGARSYPEGETQLRIKENRDGRNDFEDSKSRILDKAQRGLRESRIVPITRSTVQPSRNPPAIFQEIQTVDGDGDQILATAQGKL